MNRTNRGKVTDFLLRLQSTRKPNSDAHKAEPTTARTRCHAHTEAEPSVANLPPPSHFHPHTESDRERGQATLATRFAPREKSSVRL